jgi:hypothetical protein
MRRIRRWMLNVLTALSLALCVGTVALWVRSYWRGNQLRWATRQSTHFVTVAGGDLMVLSAQGMALLPQDHGRWVLDPVPGGRTAPTGGLAISHTFLGFQFGAGTFTSPVPTPYRVTIVPIWLPSVLLTLLPIGWTLRRRPYPGHCTQCRYDLTANVSGVCPECGTKISKAS